MRQPHPYSILINDGAKVRIFLDMTKKNMFYNMFFAIFVTN